MMLIGLNGKAGSGKDTAFTFINEWATFHGYKAERDAFADRLKISAGRALGIHSEDGSEELAFCNAIKVNSKISLKWDDGKAHHHELTGREYLQYYGTEAHRQVFSDDFWINMVLGPERPGVDILVITDVRFPNEAEAIREEGGEVWTIHRWEETGDTHASEQDLDNSLIDCHLNNMDTLDELGELVWLMMEATSTEVVPGG
jgi:hypothetical protein